MEVGKICKRTSIVLFILDFIGSVVLGNIFAIQGRYSFSDPEFNWTIFFCGIIAGFIFCLLIYALGEIIDLLKCSNCNTYELYQLLNKIISEEEKKTEPQKSYLTPSVPPVQKNTVGGWVCKNCNTKNDIGTLSCKDCGAYK